MLTENRFRILHIMKMIGLSGAEKHLFSLLPKLNPEYFDFTLLILIEKTQREFIADYSQALEKAGVKVETMVIKADFDPFLVNRLASYMARHNFHLVHTHLIHADLYGTLAAALAGVKNVVSTKHNTNPFRRNFFYAFLDRLTARYQRKIIAISQAVKDFLLEEEHLPLSKLVVIPYGLDTSTYLKSKMDKRQELGIPQTDLVLGIVARLTKQKGHTYLLKAFKMLLAKHPQLWLVIVGSGELEEELQKESRQLEIDKQVKFVGYQADPRPYYQTFDIFVHPSLWEGFGLVFLEAMAYKLPLVASRVDAIKEIVRDGESGFLVEPAMVEPLQTAIEKLILDKNLRTKMGERGYLHLQEDYTLEKLTQSTSDLYNSLLLN